MFDPLRSPVSAAANPFHGPSKLAHGSAKPAAPPTVVAQLVERLSLLSIRSEVPAGIPATRPPVTWLSVTDWPAPPPHAVALTAVMNVRAWRVVFASTDENVPPVMVWLTHPGIPARPVVSATSMQPEPAGVGVVVTTVRAAPLW